MTKLSDYTHIDVTIRNASKDVHDSLLKEVRGIRGLNYHEDIGSGLYQYIVTVTLMNHRQYLSFNRAVERVYKSFK